MARIGIEATEAGDGVGKSGRVAVANRAMHLQQRYKGLLHGHDLPEANLETWKDER